LRGNLQNLLDVLDKTPLSKDIYTSAVRLNKLILNPALFTFQGAYSIAEVIGVDEKTMVDIIHNECVSKKKKKK
jgi:hypothetical protein